MKNGETQRSLAAITDQGQFERLATAVLREANSRYRLIVHTGVNLDGKTIRSPVDGITFVAGENPPHMIEVHHTTCKYTDLEKKWLHDPATVIPHKGGRPTAPPGDLVKTIQLFAEQKQETPHLQLTLILTTNKEPSETLVRKVHAAGDSAGIEVIIWSSSALAHYLDYDAKGQWIRSRFLGIEQERLSDELLHELSRCSLKNSILLNDSELWIECQLDQNLETTANRDVVFVVAQSGFGKSVACHKRLTAHVEAGGFGLVIPHEIIAGASSLEQAIDATLRLLYPSLAPGVGSEARALASERTPLLMVVEDVNKSGQPISLIERLASWSKQQNEHDSTTSWQILCPVWPRILTALGDESRRRINRLVLEASSFTAEEGTAAVQRRYERAGIPITRLNAEALASAFGHDPLLIALHNPAATLGSDHVIKTFIEGSLERLAEIRSEFTAGEYRQGLACFMSALLERRCLNPTMTDVVSWFSDKPETVNILRHIAHFSEIIRVNKPVSNERLLFRHDRVRDWLWADAAADLMHRDAMPETVLTDPYFAEIIGAALVRNDIPTATVEHTRIANPLALFYAMCVFGEPSNNLHRTVLKAAEAWLDDETTHGPQNNYLRWTARRVLSEIDAPYVTSLVQRFRSEQNDWWGLRARFRNGDFMAGIKLCFENGPGITVVGHLELIDHVQRCRGASLVRTLDELLRHDQLTPVGRSGALRLAGHLGDPTLAGAIEMSWLADTGRDERLADYLWAGGQCCTDDAARLLAPICDSWAELPDEAEGEHSVSPRDSLAANEIRWAFRYRLPESAVRYFIERGKSPELQWPITFMLHSIDHPDAVEFVVLELTAMDDRLEGTESFSHFALTARDEWERRQEETGRAMSDASRHRLHELWTSKQNGKHLRNRAFQLWCSTTVEGDIPVLQSIPGGDDLENAALFQRLRRGDNEAITRLVEKLRQDEGGYWWQAGRYIWSDELTESLDKTLGQRGDRVERAWDINDDDSPDWILSERLMELPELTVEELLIKHWDHLRFSSYFVQAALHTATPRLKKVAAKAIAECPNVKSMFKYVTMNFGIWTKGRTGITRIAQIEALLPYFDHLGDHEVWKLWEVCNNNGWFDFRHRHLDSRVNPNSVYTYVDDNWAMAGLDDMFAKGHLFWVEHWTERFLKTGVLVDHMMEVVRTWLSGQTDIGALKMAADIVIHAGQRRHIGILSSNNIEAVDRTVPIIANACFALKRRSLN